MTSDQIAELRKLDREAKQPPWVDEGGYVYPGDPDEVEGEAVWIFGTDDCGHPPTAALIVASRNALTKLLDEREALLKALKHATDAIAAEWGDSSAQDLRSVIAKAES